MSKKILVTDDEELFLSQLEHTLSSAYYNVILARNGADALSKIASENVDLVISDFKMPVMDGLELLHHIRERYYHIPVIIMTAYGTIDLAVSTMKEGATDFLIKPFSAEHLNFVVGRIFNHQRVLEENRMLKKRIEERYSLSNIIGKNHKM